MKDKKGIQICPKCHSPDIGTDFSNAGAVARGFLEVKKCNNCGHAGTFFPKIEKTKLKKPLNKNKVKNIHVADDTFEKGLFPTTIFILGLLLTIAGLIALTYEGARILGIFLTVIGLILISSISKYLKKRKK